MATIIDQQGHAHNVSSNAKGNAALTTGIIGTSLGGLNLLGGLGNVLGGIMNNGRPVGMSNSNDMTSEDLYLERKQSEDKYNLMKDICHWRYNDLKNLTEAFFTAYQRDRDTYDNLNQKITDSTFSLYKNQRDEKDAIMDKICCLQRQVDVMSAVRPYQDALINAKIEKNAIISDFNLSKRTCRMLEGQLVLPSTPEITGFTSYNAYTES